MDMKKLLESITKFAGEPEQKPGDQVRGKDIPKKGTGFLNRLVGEAEKLKKQDNEKALETELAEKFQRFLEDNLGVQDRRPSRKGSRPARGHVPVPQFKTVKEYKKDSNNFTANDIKELEGIKDLTTLKDRAFALISSPGKKPMRPEKVAWFKSSLERMTSHTAVIKLMWDLLLSGEGHSVIGSRGSMDPNSYRRRFNEEDVAESTGVTDYNPESHGGTRKELIAQYHKTKNPKDAEAARKAGATQKELQGVAEGKLSNKIKRYKRQPKRELTKDFWWDGYVTPEEMRDRINSYSDEELVNLLGQGGIDNHQSGADGSPRAAQVKMIKRELRRRGLRDFDAHMPADHPLAEEESKIETEFAYAIQLPSGKLAKSSQSMAVWWTPVLKNAEQALRGKFGSHGEIVKVDLARDPKGHNGYAATLKALAEAPISATDNPMDPMIHGNKANPAKLSYRMLRATMQLKDLAERAQGASATDWQRISHDFKELTMNIDEIEHALGELAKQRSKGGVKSRGIDSSLNEGWDGQRVEWAGPEQKATQSKNHKVVKTFNSWKEWEQFYLKNAQKLMKYGFDGKTEPREKPYSLDPRPPKFRAPSRTNSGTFLDPQGDGTYELKVPVLGTVTPGTKGTVHTLDRVMPTRSGKMSQPVQGTFVSDDGLVIRLPSNKDGTLDMSVVTSVGRDQVDEFVKPSAPAAAPVNKPMVPDTTADNDSDIQDLKQELQKELSTLKK